MAAGFVRTEVLDAIETDLALIDGSGDYTIALARIHRDLIDAEEAAADLPAVALVALDDNILEGSTDVYHVSTELAVEMFLEADNAPAAAAASNQESLFLGDVIRAMMTVNRYHGGKTHRMRYLGFDPVSYLAAPIIGGVARFAAHWTFNINDPGSFDL